MSITCPRSAPSRTTASESARGISMLPDFRMKSALRHRHMPSFGEMPVFGKRRIPLLLPPKKLFPNFSTRACESSFSPLPGTCHEFIDRKGRCLHAALNLIGSKTRLLNGAMCESFRNARCTPFTFGAPHAGDENSHFLDFLGKRESFLRSGESGKVYRASSLSSSLLCW